MENERLQQLLGFLQESPHDSFTLYSIAYEYQQAQDFEQARNYFGQLLALDPDYVGAYYHLGKCQMALEEETAAQATLQQGIEVAKRKKDQHALSELQNALLNAELGEDW